MSQRSLYVVIEMFENASDFDPVLTYIIFWAEMNSRIKSFQEDKCY